MNIRLLIPAKCRQEKSGQWVVFNNEYNLSGYGATLKKAREMFVQQAHDVLLPMKKVPSRKNQSPLRG